MTPTKRYQMPRPLRHHALHTEVTLKRQETHIRLAYTGVRFFQAILPHVPSEERRHILQPARFLGWFVCVVILLLHTSGRLLWRSHPPRGPSVMMQEFEFTPKEMKVKVGTTVTWMNAGTAVHSATAIDKSFNTRNLQPRTRA